MENEYILNEVKKFISENNGADFSVRIGKGICIFEKK